MVRFKSLQHLDQPFALRIRVRPARARKMIDQGLVHRTAIAIAALKIQ
tara:strand:+ start:946 stop:1089 length:144 start_codon:yes stop_codon:yes gene_type:complete